MKKIKALLIFIILFITTITFLSSVQADNVFEKKDLPFDVCLDLRISTKNNRMIPIHSHRGIIPMILFNHLDIRSFSVYEKIDDNEYLYASMLVNKFKFSEYRICYSLHWTFNGISYYVGTNTHSLGEYISPLCGYWEECGTIDHNYQIEGDIIEDENSITWKIPREYIGNPKSGDTLEDLYASSHLIYQKDCSAPMKLNLASDYVRPLLIDGYKYSMQY
jgi:hypothetical protein